MSDHVAVGWARRLMDGLLIGLLLAAAETAAIVVSSHAVRPSYLVTVIAFDVALGILVIGIAVVAERMVPAGAGPFAARFVPLATAAFVGYGADKALSAPVYRAKPTALGIVLLVMATALVSTTLVLLCRRFARTRDIQASTTLSLLLFVVLLVSGLHALRSLRHGTASYALAVAVVAVVALMAQDVWFRRRTGPPAARLRWMLSAATAAVALGAVAVAWWRQPSIEVTTVKEAPGSSRPNVLLISIDTLRADRLSTYGYDRPTSPFLSALARESMLYTRALSPGTWTVPGHAAMFTGRFPGSLGALGLNGRLPPSAFTLAERLRGHGYRTGAVVANASALNGRGGWAQGFDLYADEPRQMFGYLPSVNTAASFFPVLHGRVTKRWKTAAEVNAIARAWLERQSDGPFFLFINYMDTHDPFVAPDDWVERFPGRVGFMVDPVPALLRGTRNLTPEEELHFKALYDSAVAYVDHEVGRLLASLEESGRLENTLVVVTSDHGEFFGEHGLIRHNVGPYEPVHRVPLIVRHPGGTPRGVEDRWVQLVDIVPTVLDAVGVQWEDTLDGGLLTQPGHPILVQHESSVGQHGHRGRGYSGLYEGSWKMVLFEDGTTMLFDLDADPAEVRDVAPAASAQALDMRLRLTEAAATYRTRMEVPPMDADTKERLRAGGYIQ